jgi:3-oxoacyl-[acyl-carrier protein] reductase
MLVRVLAQELAPLNITVNEIIPGPVETIQDPQTLERWRQGFREMGEWIKKPADVVPLALFMATQPNPGPSAQSFSLMRRDN